MNKLIKVISPLIVALLCITSCSTATKDNKSDERRYYSNETLDFFNRIENTRSNSFNNAQYNRVQNRNDDLEDRERIENVVIERESSRSNTRNNSAPTPIRRARPAPSRQQVSKPIEQVKRPVVEQTSNESLIEIQQHLSYYCMNSANLRRYKNSTAQCETFAQNVLENCKKASKSINKATVNCVLKKL